MSQIYKGTRDNSKSLKHFKYIKKVRKNGKWRYYYDTESLTKDFNSVYNNPNNIYDVTANNYDDKMKKIANSKEWQDIVARKDPEYVTKSEDGSTKYLIDDYLVKKKHPELDIIDDIGAGRKVSLNELTMDTAIAGAKDYIKTGQLAIAVAAKALTERFKLQQGSYKDSTSEVAKAANKGYKILSSLFK